MKKIMLVVTLMFGGAALVSAQDQQTDTRTQSQTETSLNQDQEGQQISVSQLPDEVTAKLESQDYSGWTVGTAYKKMDDSQNEIYVIEMRQGTETKKVKFDRDGNEIEKGDKSKKHKSESSQYRDDASSDQDAVLEDADQGTSDQSTTDQSATDQSTTDQADNTQSPK